LIGSDTINNVEAVSFHWVFAPESPLSGALTPGPCSDEETELSPSGRPSSVIKSRLRTVSKSYSAIQNNETGSGNTRDDKFSYALICV